MLNIKEIPIKIIEKLMALICLLQERTDSGNLMTVLILETGRRRTDRRAGWREGEWLGRGTDRETKRQTDGVTDRQTYRQTEGRKNIHGYLSIKSIPCIRGYNEDHILFHNKILTNDHGCKVKGNLWSSMCPL
ncbi:hypothetical protein DPMN_189371 [Dreissena polymorpha]|uniref:Uncharacterized protein n=1 Tax=Dreissena polymorpha TaxID=45954 RepID=A0A9D4IAR8_DREPO|nr:hypothetical protein DPMN_189371 [Dreissena polymorpha]